MLDRAWEPPFPEAAEGSIVIAKGNSAIASQCDLVQFHARDEADATTVARYLRISDCGAHKERSPSAFIKSQERRWDAPIEAMVIMLITTR